MARKEYTGLDFQGVNQVTGLPTATNPSDAVNLALLQATIAGLGLLPSVRTVAVTNININSPGAVIGGVTMAAGNRVLLTGQTSGAQNLIYIWNGASSPMTQAPDMTGLREGAFVVVQEGDNADSEWELQTTGTITVNSTALTWSLGPRVTPPGTGTVRSYSTTIGDGTSVSFTVTHNLGKLQTLTDVYDGSGASVGFDVTARTTNTVVIGLSPAPASNALTVVVLG